MTYEELLDILNNIKKQEFYKDTGKMVNLCFLMEDIINEYPHNLYKEKYETTIEFKNPQNSRLITHINTYNNKKDALTQLKYYHNMLCEDGYHCRKNIFDCCNKNEIFKRFYCKTVY